MNLKSIPFLILMFAFLLLKGQNSMVDTLKFSGIKKIKLSFVENFVEAKNGMVIDSLLMERDMLRLKRLPSITHAYYSVRALKNNRVEVNYVIEESFTLIPSANLFSSSNDDFAFRIGLKEFNFLGQNITLGAFYQFDNYSSYGIGLRAPYLFSKKLGLAFNYNDFTTLEPVFFEDDTADYKYSNSGFELLGLYEFNINNRIELGYSLFTEDYSYVEGAASVEVPLSLKVDKHLFKFIYDYNNLDYFYHYLEGFRSQLNFQYVGSANASLPEFLIGFNDFTYFKRFGSKGNWANRLRLGLASNVDSPFAPFTVDNNLNIRGVGNTIDRGTAMIVLNTEFRQTLIDKNQFVLQGNAFIDGGTWRNPAGGFDDLLETRNLRIYPGLGIRFMHKRIFNAIFRIDYGYGITKDGDKGFVFGIGQYF